MNKTTRIIGNLSALIGILVFLYPIINIEEIKLTWIQKTFISLSITICLIYLFYEIFSGPKKYKTDKEINHYMQQWIQKSGRTVIFTRDMSWVDNQEITNELLNKARRHELIICQPKITTLTTTLKNEGAEVYTYDTLNYTPKSRFTFINYDSTGAKVAIGRKDRNHKHIITEFTSQDTVEYYLAEDLVNLIKKINP